MLLSFSTLLHAQAEPPYGLGELEAYSVFSDAYRTDDYELAIQYGEWIIESKPRTLEGYDNFSLERQFERMVEVYIAAAGEESDPTQRAEYLENAEAVIEEAFETFNEDEIDYFEWYLRQGRFYQEHHGNIDGASLDDAMESYYNMYEMDAQRFAEEGDGYYAQVLLITYESDERREEALEIIEGIEGYASAELQSTIDEVRESFFQNPEERITFLESRIEGAEGEERGEILGDLVDLYEQTGQDDKALETALELYELNDNYETARKLANIYISEGDYQNGLNYLEESLEKAESPEDEKEILLEIAESYQQLEQLEQARNFAQRAIDIDPDLAEAYTRMASIYAATVSHCTGGQALDRDDRTVYWLVIDYLEQAKQADPSLAANVDNQIESYEEAMPTAEDRFFNDWEQGESIVIDGSIGECYSWINETTTIR